VLGGLVLEFGLEALGAEGEGGKIGTVDLGDGGLDVEGRLLEGAGADVFNLVVEDVVEVAKMSF